MNTRENGRFILAQRYNIILKTANLDTRKGWTKLEQAWNRFQACFQNKRQATKFYDFGPWTLD
jgi:hypothetical protein